MVKKKEKPPRKARQKQPRPAKEKRPREKKAKRRGGAGKASPVGLDLGRNYINAVQLKYLVGGAAMLSAAVDDLPDGLIQEGEVLDVDALSFAIRDFWKTNKIKGKKVALGLANQKVVVRTLEFPVLDEKELRSAIEFQAQDYIPIPIEEAILDYHVLGRFKDENSIEKLKILVVAAQKIMVMDFVNAIKKAKLAVSGIDLQAFAMLRSLASKNVLELEPASGAIALANIGSDVTNLVVEAGGEPQFTRIISFGADYFTRAVQDLKGITFKEAEVLKTRTGLGTPGERAPGEGEADTAIIPPTEGPQEFPAGEPGPSAPSEEPGEVKAAGEERPGGEPPGPAKPEGPDITGTEAGGAAEVQRVLELAAEALADEIRRSLDYYQTQEASAPVTRLLISGVGAQLPNLDRHLSQAFQFAVEIGDPLKRITQNRTGFSDEDLRSLGPRLAIAIGLALEDEE
ncbi:MAG: type IV pilus assembly protein PilM [Thermoleophilia bacterium]|nr:type IV pilus assembly protein PilM [Thermoleophilia bacterium]